MCLCVLYMSAMLDDDCGSSCDQDSCTTSDSDNDPLSGVLNYFGRSANKKKHQQGGQCASSHMCRGQLLSLVLFMTGSVFSPRNACKGKERKSIYIALFLPRWYTQSA